MEFRDLKMQYQVLKTDIDAALLRVAASGQYIGGAELRALEEELAEYCGRRYCVSCANGTDALVLGLKALGIGEGDAVFVPDFTFFATAEAPCLCGAVPVFIDVEAESFNISAASLEREVRRVLREGKLRPACVIPVDLFGLPYDYEQIKAVAERYELKVIEDAAQGFGGRIGERRACSFGDLSTTSFFPAKPLGCYGDGGAVFTDDERVRDLLESLKVHGKGKEKYDNVRIGTNSRLDHIQAAVLRVKLRAFREYELAAVQDAAARYDRLLREAGLEKDLILPRVPEPFSSSYAQYTLRLRRSEVREALAEALKQRGIPTMVYYPKSMSRQTALLSYAGDSDCRTAQSLAEEVLSLPMHPYLKEEEQAQVVAALKDFFAD